MGAINAGQLIAIYMRNWMTAQKNIQYDLVKCRDYSRPTGPIVFAIMDGVGVNPINDEYNAVAMAETPNLDWLKENSLYTELVAHGTAVGLPSDDDIGNSEVGHNAIGAGRWTPQSAVLVNRLIETGEFFESEVLNENINQVKTYDSSLHLMGLLQKVRIVHSNTDHAKAIIGHAVANGVKRIYFHGLLDGRDDPPEATMETVDDMQQFMDEQMASHPGTKIQFVSGGGRMKITMDRNLEEPEMVKNGWQTHVNAIGRQFSSMKEAVETLYRESSYTLEADKFMYMDPFIIAENGGPVGRIKDKDAVFWVNYRGDRSLEISRSFTEDESFDLFDRGDRPDVLFGGLIAYDSDANIPPRRIVEPYPIYGTISELLAKQGVPQLAITEGQKYSHLTFFWNGNQGRPFDPNTEQYIKIPSDLPTSIYSKRPEMKSGEITEIAIRYIQSGLYPFIRINYPNGDMVGHTGDLLATILGMEAVDRSIGQLKKFVEEHHGILVVTADHGNADDMAERDKSGNPKIDKNGLVVIRNSHTINPVPFYMYSPGMDRFALNNVIIDPSLTNIASTLLFLLGYEQPRHMDPRLIIP